MITPADHRSAKGLSPRCRVTVCKLPMRCETLPGPDAVVRQFDALSRILLPERHHYKESSMSDDLSDQQKLSRDALHAKTQQETDPHHPVTDDHAHDGMISKPLADQAPSGAFDAEGHRPVLERSRKVR